MMRCFTCIVRCMSFPNKAARQACWDARDQFWACLDANAENAAPCSHLRELYEKGCPSQWVSVGRAAPANGSLYPILFIPPFSVLVKHFDRKRSYEKFKDKIQNQGLCRRPHAEGGTMQYVKLLPHKVMRRYLLAVVVWTLCCYAVYR
ncbi:Cytochrome c oxidase assembly factor 6 [Amphibalanus amphitrite]|uniref:Cytochrome c oxidase assembly factor 6 n=1 Tax=Amphibalanus amphitrite TaxID=1232801 RepID=A0A6A4VXS7_AMPAM|nr:Cytochrome c oxidase assembly factor 6 [Amphibalanus amphitrite]